MTNKDLKPYVDIAFIVPLLEEFKRLEKIFPLKSQRVIAPHVISELDLFNKDLRAVSILQDGMGKTAAIRATTAIIAEYDIGVLIVIGIAGGLSDDVAIGDVCFTGTVIDVLENMKVSDSSNNNLSLSFNTQFYPTDSLFTFALKYAEIGADTLPIFTGWQEQQYYAGASLVPGVFIGRGDKNEVISIPKIHDGNIVCGSISKSDIYKSNIKSIERKMLALETESGGVFHSAQYASIPAISVRGICDYADKNKSKIEEQTRSHARAIAADNAVTFIQMQLNNAQFLKILSQRRDAVNAPGALPPPLNDDIVFAQGALAECSATAHQQLTLLSPEYQGKPQGYRLPVPRVKGSQASITIGASLRRGDPINILEAIAANRLIAMDVPRSYPDKSLPWVIAAELTHIQLDGKQAVPIVIAGDGVGPPHGTFQAKSHLDLRKLNESPIARPVIILTDVPPNSRVRIEFLKREIQKYPNSHVLIINSHEFSVDDESVLVLSAGAAKFDITDISFSEMSQFFQRTFSLDDQEASVVALKFKSMFDRFRLNAHPSYFAGVGSEVLHALLRANRRSELLQIAVTGFLSFIVASDNTDVVLSRTTREAFLRRLAFEMKVIKRQFSQSDIIEYTKYFADASDFEIDPIQFIKSFQDKGILHFENGRVCITLPFIESYLLASELVQRPIEAKAYFQLSSDDFDFSTFDIYAELGPHPDVVAGIIQALDDAVSTLRADPGRDHILLTDEIRPVAVDRKKRIEELQKELNKAVDDVLSNRPNGAEKQKLLDIANRIEMGAKQAQENSRQAITSDEVSMLERLSQPFNIWTIATILIGSGAERLTRVPKRELADAIVGATAILMDELMRAFPRSSLSQFKEEMSRDDTLREFFELDPNEPVADSIKEMVMALLDTYELSMLGFPIRAIFGQLCNAAGQSVLSPSVSAVLNAGKMEQLIAGVWAAEINANRNKKFLMGAIRNLPPSPFFRWALYSHFMARVYWNQWQIENRLALLDAADECIAPLEGSRIDKGKVRRQVTRRTPTQ